MNRGEELIMKFEEAVVRMNETYHAYYEREKAPEYKEACKQAQIARILLLDYVADLEAQGEAVVTQEEIDASCGDFVPEDFDMIEEHMEIMRECNDLRYIDEERPEEFR